MVSVIIATKNNRLLSQLTDNIKKTIGVEYEIIAIEGNTNNKGICHIYNQGAQKAKFPFLCFIHEDILFHTDGWGKNLIKHLQNNEIALIGILGALIKTRSPSGVYIPIPELNRINQLQRTKENSIVHYYQNPYNEPYSEVKLLDGMFLATTKSNHTKYNFDEELLTAFHGYDVDYSLGQSFNGKVVVVYDILLEHFSFGGNTTSWVEAQLKITNKWLPKLPQQISLNNVQVLQAEIVNTETFLNTLHNIGYSKSTQFKYLLLLLRLRKLSFKNFYFVRRLLIYGSLEKGIKSIIHNH